MWEKQGESKFMLTIVKGENLNRKHDYFFRFIQTNNNNTLAQRKVHAKLLDVTGRKHRNWQQKENHTTGFFFHSESNQAHTLRLECCEGKNSLEKCSNSAVIELGAKYERDRVHSIWLNLAKNQSASSSASSSGPKVLIRFLFTHTTCTGQHIDCNTVTAPLRTRPCKPRTPDQAAPPMFSRFSSTFFYRPLIEKFKTGDLLLFAAPGLVGSTVKLYQNFHYSNVGFVVSLPNKYTYRDELYVLQVCRNLHHLYDAFDDRARHGVSLFRLTERIHQFQGSEIGWLPLKEPLADVQLDQFCDWVWDFYSEASERRFFETLNKNLAPESASFAVRETLRKNFGLSDSKDPHQYTELFAPQLIAQGLYKAHLISDTQRAQLSKNSLSIHSLLALSCYDDVENIQLLRTSSNNVENAPLLDDAEKTPPQPVVMHIASPPPSATPSPLSSPRVSPRDASPPQDASPLVSQEIQTAMSSNPSVTQIPVVLENKTSAHPMHGHGSNKCFSLGGTQGAKLNLAIDHEYIFNIKCPGYTFYLTTNPAGGPTDAATNLYTYWYDATDYGKLYFVPHQDLPKKLFYMAAEEEFVGGEIHLFDE